MPTKLKSLAGTPEADVSALEIARLKVDLEQERVKSQRYRLATESATNLLYEWDLGSGVEWLGQVDELLGYQPNEFPRTWEGYTSLFHSEDRNRVLAAIEKRLKSEEPYSVECRVQRKDGTYLYWQDRGTVIRDESGKPVKWLGAVSDITERKRAEEALEAERGLMRTLIDNLPDNVFIKDTRGGIILDNLAHRRLLGRRELDDVVGKSDRDFFAPALADQYMDDERRIVESGQPLINYEEPTVDQEGRPHWYLTTKVPVRDSHGNITALVGINRDITERKQAEQEIASLAKFPSENPYPVLRLSRDGIVMYANAASGALLGMWGCAMGGTIPQFWCDLAAQALASRENKTEDIECDGKVYSMVVTPVAEPGYVNLYGRDITERKRAEEALKESENKYRLLADNAQDVIFVLDMNLKYTYVSPSVKILRGYEPEEALKQTSFEILTPSSRDLAMRTLSEIMELEKSERRDISISRTLELEIGRKDGSTVWTEVRFSFIRDENQRPVGILGVTRDITQRKREIERVRKALGATVQAIAMTVETRDPYTAGHQRRVADLARAIAMEMNLPSDMIDGIRMAAAIHDLGKISVPAEMLSKPTKLTDLEFRIIKTHSQSGYDILKDIEFPWPVARIVVEHHERINGSGYPNGLTGDKVLMESRILSVADVVEAMASHRPYRSSLGIEAALNEISKNKGILYEPEVVDACLRLFHDKDYKIID